MNGLELRKALSKSKVSIVDLAEKLNMTQPNLSNAFKVQDVKSGMLEKICDALGVTIDFFYGGTKYMKNGGEGYVAKEETVGVAQEEDAAILYKKRQRAGQAVRPDRAQPPAGKGAGAAQGQGRQRRRQ